MTDARLTVKRFRVNRNNLLDKVDQKGYADFLRLDVLAVKASDYDALLQRVEELERTRGRCCKTTIEHQRSIDVRCEWLGTVYCRSYGSR